MDRGTVWPIVYILGTIITGQSELARSHGFLKGAVAGFDPFFMTSITSLNPGRRSSLFQHLGNQHIPYSFINNEEETSCLPDITVRNIVNYKDFKDFSSSSAYELSFFDPKLGTLTGYKNFTSCENKNDFRDRAMLQFFKDTRGEVVVASSSCVTHTITIAPFEPVTFTPAFQSALVTLYKAALNPMPEIRNTVFTEFIRFYGTHFSRRTRLGSRVIFGKLFSTRAATVVEERARRRCVQEAAYEALTPEARRSNETTRTVFTSASSECCGGGEHKTIISVTGPLPGRSLQDWATESMKSPQPIFHDLEPLSFLFNKDWFDRIHQSMQLDMNGTTLHNFFQEQLSDYSSRMVCGGSNKSPSRGCTIDSNCTTGTECRNEPYTAPGYICVPKDESTTPAPTTTSTTKAPATTAGCSACGGLLNAVVGETKTLTSHPGFGTSNYENLATFGHILEAPAGHKVRIHFRSFHTEGTHDTLYIYSGHSPSGTRLATLSGTPALPTYTSSGTTMSLLFSTDGSAVYPGFSLLYDAVV